MADMRTTHELILKYDGYVNGMTKAALAAERLKTARQRTATETERTRAAEARAEKATLDLARAQERATRLAMGAASGNQKVAQTATLAGKATGYMAGNTLLAAQQMQDFALQVAGGQNPLLALAQQGSQLQYQFGSIGAAIKGVGSIIGRALTNPVTLAAGAVGALALAYNQGANESQALNAALITTGNYAGVTAGQLGDMAEALGNANTYTQAFAAEALTALVSTGRVGGENLELLTDAAVNMQRYGGLAVKDFAKNVADLGKEPYQASLRLNESMRYLNAETLRRIKELQDVGQFERAAAEAQIAYGEASQKVANQLKDNLGTLESAWDAIASAAKKAWDQMLGVGRAVSLEKQISEQQKFIEDLTLSRGVDDPLVLREAAILANLQGQLKTFNEIAKQREEQAKSVDKMKEFLALQDKYLDDEARLKKEIQRIESLRGTKGITDAEIDALIKAASSRADEQRLARERQRALEEFRRGNEIWERGQQGRATVRAMGFAAMPDGEAAGLARLEEQFRLEQEKLELAQRDAIEAGIANEQEYADTKLAIQQKYYREVAELQYANQQLALKSAEEGFGSIADILKMVGKESSDAYRAMFRISKAFAIADAVIKIQQGIANAAAAPFPANFAAMAQVAAATASIVSNIQAVREPPRFHTGGILGEEVPFIGKKGEGVFTEAQMKKLAPAGSAAKVEVNVYNAPQGTTVQQGVNDDGGMRIDVMVENLAAKSALTQGAPLSRAIRSGYGLQPAMVQRG
jgi:phage-related minor tail protein